MHASNTKTEMNEEAFQILFDVMEKHFAALKINPDSHYKLTRAVSFSELPSSRRICLQQSYQSGEPSNLIRQYSCEQIVDTAANTSKLKISEVVRTGNDESQNVWERTVPYFDAFKIPDLKQLNNRNAVQAPSPISHNVEYMEVDHCEPCKSPGIFSHSTNEYGVTERQEIKLCNESNKVVLQKADKGEQVGVTKEETQNTYQDIKKKLRPLIPKADKPLEKKGKMCSCYRLMFFLLLPVALIMIGITLSPDEDLEASCDYRTNFLNASDELQRKIYGQSKAIHELIYFLKDGNTYLKVLCLVGGTGVGKSYTADIIRKNFPFKNNIFLYFPPLIDSINARVLSTRYSNLIIFENLGIIDAQDLANSLEVLKRLEGYCITVLAIFNIEQINNDLTRVLDLEQSMKIIITSFKDMYLRTTVIPYQPLAEDALELCIQDAAESSSLVLKENQLNRVKQSLLSSNSGCKGAYTKVQVIGRERI